MQCRGQPSSKVIGRDFVKESPQKKWVSFGLPSKPQQQVPSEKDTPNPEHLPRCTHDSRDRPIKFTAIPRWTKEIQPGVGGTCSAPCPSQQNHRLRILTTHVGISTCESASLQVPHLAVIPLVAGDQLFHRLTHREGLPAPPVAQWHRSVIRKPERNRGRIMKTNSNKVSEAKGIPLAHRKWQLTKCCTAGVSARRPTRNKAGP